MLFEALGLIEDHESTVGLIPIVGTLEKVLVEIDFTNVLVVMNSLFVDCDVVDGSLRRNGGNLFLDIIVSEPELLHGLLAEIPTNGSFQVAKVILYRLETCPALLGKVQRVHVLELDSLVVSRISAHLLLEVVCVRLVLSIRSPVAERRGGKGLMCALTRLHHGLIKRRMVLQLEVGRVALHGLAADRRLYPHHLHVAGLEVRRPLRSAILSFCLLMYRIVPVERAPR